MPENLTQAEWDELNDRARETEPALDMQCRLPDGDYICECLDVGIRRAAGKILMFWRLSVHETDPSGYAGSDDGTFEHCRWLTGSESNFGIAMAQGDIIRIGVSKAALEEIKSSEANPWPVVVELARSTGIGKVLNVKAFTNAEGYKNTSIMGLV